MHCPVLAGGAEDEHDDTHDDNYLIMYAGHLRERTDLHQVKLTEVKLTYSTHLDRLGITGARANLLNENQRRRS
jgi:hypothetical protein